MGRLDDKLIGFTPAMNRLEPVQEQEQRHGDHEQSEASAAGEGPGRNEDPEDEDGEAPDIEGDLCDWCGEPYNLTDADDRARAGFCCDACADSARAEADLDDAHEAGRDE